MTDLQRTHSGVCHSDLGVMENRYGALRITTSLPLADEYSWAVLPYPTQPGQIGGHEGVGHVVKLGPGADKSNIKLGDRVGIKVRKPYLQVIMLTNDPPVGCKAVWFMHHLL